MFRRRSHKKIYLDYAATTPVASDVAHAMEPYFFGAFGNPSSLHSFGQEAMAAVDRSREAIARSLGIHFRGVIFTASATEANNLALRGVLSAARQAGMERPRLVISAIEHESVLETARDLERGGAEIVVLPVGRDGVIDLAKLREAINERTALVSVMYANNEVGTVEPVQEIGRIVREASRAEGRSHRALFHTDAVQAFQFLQCSPGILGADMVTLSAHKIYGPKGIGALCLSDECTELLTVTTGGGQEFGLRSGTENVPSIVGFARAVALADDARRTEAARIRNVKDYFWSMLSRIVPNAAVHGRLDETVLPNILNVHLPDWPADELLAVLDRHGLAASSGSACAARSVQPSSVLRAMGYSAERARRSVRFSFGRPTTRQEIDRALAIFKIITADIHKHSKA